MTHLTAVLTTVFLGQHPPKAKNPEIPPWTTVFGVTIGADPISKLEKTLGKGNPRVGGHPNGARAWYGKIYADAFERTDDGCILDGINCRTWKGELRSFIKARNYRPGMFDRWKWGTDFSALEPALRAAKFEISTDLTTRKRGKFVLKSGELPSRTITYEVRILFKDRKLDEINWSADPGVNP